MSDRGGADEKEDMKIHEEALKYLEKAEEIYQIVIENTKDMPQKTIMNNFDLYLLKQSKQKEDVNFAFFINSGLDLKRLDAKYTTTLFVLAQIHSKLGNVEQGMNFCGMCMKRQLTQNEYELKDWVVNATTLADAYLAKEYYA